MRQDQTELGSESDEPPEPPPDTPSKSRRRPASQVPPTPELSPFADGAAELYALARTVDQASTSRRSNLVNFRHIVEARVLTHKSNDKDVRDHAAQLLPQLVHLFDRRFGGIQKMSFYEQVGAGIALTDITHAARHYTPAIHIEAVATERRDPKARHLVMRALDLHNRALQHLPPTSRRILLLRLHTLLESFLGQSEGALKAGGTLEKEDYASLEKELNAAQRYYERSAQRGAQLTYFTGTIVALVPAIIVAIYMVWPDKGRFDIGLTNDERLLAACALAGAGGAAVSVMTRLASGKLNLSGLDEASRTNLLWFGGIRTLLGLAFGALVFLFIFSTVLAIKVPDPGPEGQDTRLYFLIVLGFIAGFSERFAQDALAGAEASVSGAASASPTPGPRKRPARTTVR